MGIVFFCQSCGARFEVDPRSAGKKGRCKKCGQHVTIPRAEQIASMAAMPALAAAGVGAAAGTGAPAAGPPSIGSWLRGGVSSAALAPLTIDRMPAGVRRGSAPSPLDDLGDSKPYALAEPERGESRGRVTRRAGAVARVWRREVGGIQKLFRKLNETAYLVSVPFLMILLLGAVVRSRPLALFGATVVVLLNIGRIVAGVANLAVVPLREGVNVKKMKKPFRRVVEPVLTIGLVVLAFTFIPWLSTGAPAKGGVAGRIRSGAEALEKDMRGEVERTVDQAKDLDVAKLGERARESLKTIGTGPGDSPGATGTGQSAADAVRGLVKGVGQRARKTVEESQTQP
jgi:hypothetical protein